MAPALTVKEIVVEYLRANGYDGLYNDEECGCSLEDFMPCGECLCYCIPGVKKPMPEGGEGIGPKVNLPDFKCPICGDPDERCCHDDDDVRKVFGNK